MKKLILIMILATSPAFGRGHGGAGIYRPASHGGSHYTYHPFNPSLGRVDKSRVTIRKFNDERSF
jgi:hypothetical protein